jgi:hypothetical protein
MFEQRLKFEIHSRIKTGHLRYDIDHKKWEENIRILFKTASFFPKVLQQQLTTIDFISYCGGSLGLFLGFSAVSSIEIVYYFTLRIICLKKQQAKVADISQESKKSNYLIESVENSSVHGCNQIVMEKRHWIERIIWILLVATAVVFCSTTTYDFFIKYKEMPIMMKYEDSLDISEEITFPAITFNNEYASKYIGVQLYIAYHGLSYEWIMEYYGER